MNVTPDIFEIEQNANQKRPENYVTCGFHRMHVTFLHSLETALPVPKHSGQTRKIPSLKVKRRMLQRIYHSRKALIKHAPTSID
jgi:hypothetical protein